MSGSFFSPATSVLIAEFVGTFLFVLTIPLATIGIGSLAPIPIGFILMAMIFSFAYISGGHFNPAVSFAAFMSKKLPFGTFVRYMVVQVAAAIFATLYGTSIVGVEFPAPTMDSTLVKLWQAFCAELVYTFALATVVLHTGCSRQKNNEYAAFAVGMTVLAAGFSVGGFTGGAFNPAVATGTQLVRCITGDCNPLLKVWLYWAAPMLGAFLGAIFYVFLDTEKPASATMATNPRLEDFH